MTAATQPPRRRLTRRARRLLALVCDLGGEWTTGRAAHHLGCGGYDARHALNQLADHGQMKRCGPRDQRTFHPNDARTDNR